MIHADTKPPAMNKLYLPMGVIPLGSLRDVNCKNEKNNTYEMASYFKSHTHSLPHSALHYIMSSKYNYLYKLTAYRYLTRMTSNKCKRYPSIDV